MNDVAGRDEQADLGTGGHDHRLIHLEQVMLALRRGSRLLHRRRQVRVEAEAVLHVIVVPFPLVARDLDREVGLRRVLHREDRLGRGERHEQQDQERDHGPDHLDQRVLVELVRLVPDRLPVPEHRVEHHAEHTDEDDDADPENEGVQVVHLPRERRHRRLQVPVKCSLRQTGCRERQGRDCPQKLAAGVEFSAHHAHPGCVMRSSREPAVHTRSKAQ
jgi:hypothetical protein